jgi:L-ascorbate metabolism protein UlaG (beta-lactamase superfamily)
VDWRVGTNITWLGHSAFLIHGKDKVLIDPFLSGNPKASVSADEVDCDIICVTHGHNDHLGDAVNISKRTNAPIVSIIELSNCLEKLGVKSVGFNIGGTVEIEKTSITLVPAVHSCSVGMLGLESSASIATGMVIDSGKVVYHAGDTCVFGDMALIGAMYKPEVALLPIGGFFTMDPKQAGRAVSLVRPKIAIPMHYGTWPQIEQEPEEFQKAVRKHFIRASLEEIESMGSIMTPVGALGGLGRLRKKSPRKTRVVILEPGQTLEVSDPEWQKHLRKSEDFLAER